MKIDFKKYTLSIYFTYKRCGWAITLWKDIPVDGTGYKNDFMPQVQYNRLFSFPHFIGNFLTKYIPDSRLSDY